MWVFNIILAQSASLSISNIAKPVQIFYVIFRIMENWRIDMILLCLKWFCSIENLIEWLNSRKAYKKQTLILLEKYLERKSERPGKIFPIQMEREKLDIFHLPRKEESWKVFPKIGIFGFGSKFIDANVVNRNTNRKSQHQPCPDVWFCCHDQLLFGREEGRRL